MGEVPRRGKVCSVTLQKQTVSQSQRELINAAPIRALRGMWGTFLKILSVNTNFYQNYETQGQRFAKVTGKKRFAPFDLDLTSARQGGLPFVPKNQP